MFTNKITALVMIKLSNIAKPVIIVVYIRARKFASLK